jgi:hypothetical protein
MRHLLVFCAFCLLSFTAMAHAYHASIMEVQYNPKKQQLEVALKVFTDDFEKGLSAASPIQSRSTSFLQLRLRA